LYLLVLLFISPFCFFASFCFVFCSSFHIPFFFSVCFLFISVRVNFPRHSSCLTCLFLALLIFISFYLCPLLYLSPVLSLFLIFLLLFHNRLLPSFTYFIFPLICFFLPLSLSLHTHTHTHIHLAMVRMPEQLSFNFRQGQSFSLLQRLQTSREANQSASQGP